MIVQAETEGWGCRVHDLVVFAEALHPGLSGALWPRSPKPLLEAAVAQGSIQVRDAEHMHKLHSRIWCTGGVA